MGSVKQFLKDLTKMLNCKNVVFFFSEEIPVLGGSPDVIISCDCCGRSCLKVKCLFPIRNISPMDSEVKLPYMKRLHGGHISINSNHKCYPQCKVQIAVSKLKQSYFFIWTAHGYFFEKINFDEELWYELKKLFTDFYFNHYVPYLFSK